MIVKARSHDVVQFEQLLQATLNTVYSTKCEGGEGEHMASSTLEL